MCYGSGRDTGPVDGSDKDFGLRSGAYLENVRVGVKD